MKKTVVQKEIHLQEERIKLSVKDIVSKFDNS